ncbi:MAG: 4-hydroxy-tetrahydrodipicolinate synthase [Acidobacteriota bacterium]
MKKSSEISGCGTALVTPFTRRHGVDLVAYTKLIRRQVEAGIDFVVPCGTTGESVTLGEEEYRSVIRTCVETVSGEIPVVAGAGSNSTAHALHLARIAEQEGADALLSVTPYYNKPTQEGVFRHFQKLSQETALPVIVYNVPGRTGSNILPQTEFRLAHLPSIIGVKEASGNLDQIMEILAGRENGFRLFSGDDALALAVATLGGDGLISVAANLIPAEMTRLIRLARRGTVAEARQIHYRYLRLMNLNFAASNPIPIKYALSRMGWIEEVYRLPLCPMAVEKKEKMDAELERLGLLKA